MTRNSFSRLLAAAVAAAAVAGCSGDKGATGPQGPQGPAGPGTTTTTSATSTSGRLYAKITAVSVPNATTTGGAPTITYRLYSDAAMTNAVTACAGNAGGYAAFTPNFTIAKLVDDPANPGTKMWKSYINKLINTPPVSVATAEGGHDSVAGTLKDNGDGSCNYTYVADLSKPVAVSTNAAVTETYDPAADTRFGMQNNPSEPSATEPAFDGFADFVPSTGALQSSDPRMLVADAACNACHYQLAHHGAKRLSVGYCVTCHNASTPDPDPTSQNSTSLNLGVMIHKIHQGSLLPSVTGKNLDGSTVNGLASGGKLVVNGTDYTAVTFPQDTGNCTVCHNVPSGTGSDYWKMQPSIAFCGSCHDRTDFADATAPSGWTRHTGGAPLADGSCAICHAAGSQIADVTKFHALAAPTPANQKANYKILSVTNTAPGQNPVVTFSVTNPANNNANFDLATDPLWTAGSNSRLYVTFGWTSSTNDNWNNNGSGQVAGQPYNIAVVNSGVFNSANVAKNSDGTYTATATTAIPTNITGSGVVLIEGHPGTTTGTRYSVTTPTMNFAVTDSSPVARRQVVDVTKCDKCHGLLSLHGNNRTDNIDACVICHNTSATDVQQRGGVVSTLDNKDQQSIQLAVMVHAIHTGAEPPYTPGIVVYGFGGRPVDLRDVKLPEGNSVGKCFICHTDANPIPSANIGLTEDVTTGNSNTTDQTQFIRVSRIAAVCSSCHSSSLALTHMQQNGANSVLPSSLTPNSPTTTPTYVLGVPGAFPTGGAETCSICHGAGQIADTALFHGK